MKVFPCSVAGIPLLCLTPLITLAQTLPVPCSAGACGENGPQVWVSEGDVSGARSGNSLNIVQNSDRATLNWASFDIGADGIVNFQQPGRDSVALNRIFQNDPSRIFGALNANGQVYLLNQNGIIFGETAVVNVATLIASSLDLTPEAVQNGILGASRQQPGAPAFALFTDADGNALESGAVTVEAGAFLGAENGQIFLFAPEVVNRGDIETPNGQTILAAGDSIYLAASSDPNLTGLIVEVDGEGVVTNGDLSNAGLSPAELLGRIRAERGNVTLASLAVNQLGLVSATTSVRQNGSIRLVAREGVTVRTTGAGDVELLPSVGGSVVIGENSVTEVTLADDDATTVDVNEQPRSLIDIDGKRVSVLDDAQIVATGGAINVTARPDPRVDPAQFEAEGDDSRLYIAAGATLDVSGATTELSVERNIVEVELRGSQLSDSPAQRDSAIRGETVRVDIRESGVRSDGSAWQGTPLADASGEISNVERDVQERNLTGGTITLASQGDVIVADGAVLDVSGGVINYTGGDVTTSRLLGANGQLYDISDADRDREYVRVADAFVVEHPKWGVTEVFAGYPADVSGNFEAGYVEGKDAGSVSILAPNFILDGEIRAETVRGRYQRLAPTPVPESSLYRPFDQIPLGGALVLGSADGIGPPPNYVTDRVVFAPGEVLPDIAETLGRPFDPLTDLLPEFFVSRLDPNLIAEDQVTRLSVFANEQIDVAAEVSIDAPGGTTLDLTAARVEFDGDFRSPGGSLEITAEVTETRFEEIGIDIGETSEIDVSGVWVNDNPLLDQPETLAPLFLDGGEVSLNVAEGDLILAAGSRIDVSGGAHRSADGVLSAGRGGRVSLGAEPLAGEIVEVGIGAELSAYALFEGGSLEISAASVCIADDDCATDPGEIWLTPDLYLSRGFSDIDITANLVGLELVAGTQISARQQNFLLPEALSLLPSTRSIADFARVGLLPDVDRRAVSLRLATEVTVGITPDLSDIESLPILLLGEGSRIDADPRANIELVSTSRADINGSIIAPGGTVAISAIRGGLPPQTGVRGVRLGEGAVIDVSGTSIIREDALGRRAGEVLDGGEIRLTADLGSIVTAPTSELRLDGAADELDIRGGSAANPVFSRQRVGSDGGSLSLTAAEAILFSGQVSAKGGDAEGTSGGNLAVTIDGNLRGDDPGGSTGEPIFSLNPRQIVLTNENSPISLASDSEIPAQFVGQARLAVDTIEGAGFADLSLSAESLFGLRFGTDFLASQGEIRFEGPVDLNLPGSIRLNAANVSGGGGDVSLTSNYLLLGHENVDPRTQNAGTAAASQVGQLTLDANLIDLAGNFRVRGFESVNAESRGDIRLIGEQVQGARALTGSLNTAADLFLVAAQIYPTTLSDFAIRVEGEEGRLEIGGSGQDLALVLSAGGGLTLEANTIVQGGTLRAPLGEIELNATDLVFTEGSTTSTSLDNAVIPFGTVQGGFDWTYALESNQTLVFDGDLNRLPEQLVSMNADRIDIGEGALIDVSAGGDLLAYEFIPGLGGSDDFLSAEVSPNTFAILPDNNPAYAPYDPAESPGVGLNVGDTVYLEGVGDLSSGEYTLLPARYALLPGAVLVTAVEGYTDILPDERFVALDGSVIVAGRRAQSGTDFIESRTSGFALRPGSDALLEAEYRTALATEFFAASNLRTPADAGVLEINTGTALSLDGQLQSSSAQGRGAEVSLVADNLRLVESFSGADGVFVEVRASDLLDLAAESILLGGVRRTSTDGATLDVLADRIVVDDELELSAPELVLVARDTISVGARAEIVGEGRESTPDDLLLDGDSAVLRVSAGGQASIERTGSSGDAGDIVIGEDVLISGDGSVALDASRGIEFGGRLSVNDGSLRLGASVISLGDTSESVAGLLLGSEQLASIDASRLELVSQNAIGVYGDSELRVSEVINLRAPGLTAADPMASLTLEAPTVLIEGSLDPAEPPAASADGAGVTVLADTVVLADGRFDVSGFGDVSLQASDSVLLSGEGVFSAGNDLRIVSQLIAAGTAADYRVSADDSLTMASGPGGEPPAETGGLGGRLEFSADRISVETELRARSGIVSLEGLGNDVAVRLSESANVDVAGTRLVFDDTPLETPGGSVNLTARAGDIVAESGSSISVAALGEAAAGALTVMAESGQVDLSATLDGSSETGTGGSLFVDAESFAALPALFRAAVAGNFNNALSLRQRGTGDLTVDAATELAASHIAIENDGGAILIDGVLDTGAQAGGSVLLFANDDVRVNGDVLFGAEDGSVMASSTAGAVEFAEGSRLDLAGGELQVSVSREAADTLLDGDSSNDQLRFDGQTDALERFILIGNHTYVDADGRITADETAANAGNARFADLSDFAAGAATIAEALRQDQNPGFAVRAGLTILSPGDLELTTDWNLSPWRFDGQPGLLTLVAGGDLLFDGSLSDGFATASTGDLTTTEESWSYRMAAGADPAAANALRVQLDAEAGNVVIAPGEPGSDRTPGDIVAIRTGTGDIDIAAAGDLVLGNQASVIYTAGVDSGGIRLTQRGDLGDLAYPDRGGDISVDVGRDIVGAPSDQLFTTWLWRTGRGIDTVRPNATAWTVNFSRFEQGIGALGGGDVQVAAGRDILDLSAVVPSIGRQVGGVTAEDSIVEIAAGGDLDVSAGRDIRGGNYLAGRGEATIRADGEFGASETTGLASILGLGDSSASITARDSVTLQTVVNPTLLPQSAAQRVPGSSRSYFSTYVDDSRLLLTSIAGDVTLSDSLGENADLIDAQFEQLLQGSDALALQVLPPVVEARAASGDINIEGSVTLFPSSSGDLRLIAGEDIILGTRNDSIQLILSDVDPAVLPSIDSPDSTLAGPITNILTNPNSILPEFNAATPLHSGNTQPALLIAGRGDVRMLSPSAFNEPLFWSAKPVRVVAGTDIENFSLYAQNLGPDTVTSLVAGRDIIYPNERTPDGALALSNRSIDIAGDGALRVIAGRDVDLQTSSGITSRGNLRNPALADSGASINVLAGIAGAAPDYAAFSQTYLIDGEEYDEALSAYLGHLGVDQGNGRERALAAFEALEPGLQRNFIEEVFFLELRASGRAAAEPGESNGDFTRGFEALETLFPGSNPDIDAGETNAYLGDVALFFSRIYTLDGGDIRILAPGGLINAGLATPPVAFGLGKSPEQLGVVVQSTGDVQGFSFGDFAVNESRVFAADGGDILIWSTRGDIDAGRGAKTAISAPPPQIIIDPETGATELLFPAALTGSGIQTLGTSVGVEPGNVDLFAPGGVVNAGDAGIVAGNLTIAAVAVLGADNIDVSGVSIGVPVDTAVAPGLANVSAVGSSASRSAEAAVDSNRDEDADDTPLADNALGWLDVFVVGFGDCDPATGENCDDG